MNLHGRGPQSHRLLAAAGPRRIVAYACPEAGVDGPRWNEAEHEVRRWTRLVDAAASRRGVPGACHPDDLRLHVPGDPPTVGRQRYAVLHPGASSGARRWPARRWARVAAALERRGVPVVLTGGPDERALVAGVAATAGLSRSRCTAGELSLHGLAQLVAGASLLVCGDTGVAHLGTALGTPSVLLFGPVPPSRWGPLADPELHTVLWHGDALGEGDPHADRCDPSLLRVPVDEVLSAAIDRLERVSRGYGLRMTEPFPPEPLPDPTPPSPVPPEPLSPPSPSPPTGPPTPGPDIPDPVTPVPGPDLPNPAFP